MFDKIWKRASLATLVGLAIASLTSGPIGAQSVPQAGAKFDPSNHIAAPPSRGADAAAVVLYDQNNNPGTYGISSQNFEAVYNAYDSHAADSFPKPTGVAWRIMQVDAEGLYFNGTGPATSFNVVYHKNAAGLPKDPPNPATIRNGMAYTLVGSNTFRITVSPPIVLPKASNGGFVSVQANMDFAVGGQWGWLLRTVQSGPGAAWKNPNGGFGVCPVWTDMNTCIPTVPATEQDHLFTLSGVVG
jgi:hypothetical protein